MEMFVIAVCWVICKAVERRVTCFGLAALATLVLWIGWYRVGSWGWESGIV